MPREDSPESAAASGPARVAAELAWVTLPADDARTGRSWADALREAGHGVHALGLLAPAIAAERAIGLGADALLLAVGRRTVRRAVQSLIAHLQYRNAKLPVLLAGPGVDADFAQWVAVPQGGVPYWGGVYYCADATEAAEVLRQIVLFEPPPAAEGYDHDVAAGADACGSCSACPLSSGCELEDERTSDI
ncbi:MAG: hypothetical protein ACP5HG_14155 [Anaerolineae bacterium]